MTRRLRAAAVTVALALSTIVATLGAPVTLAAGFVCPSGPVQHYGPGAAPVNLIVDEAASGALGRPNAHQVCVHETAGTSELEPDLKTLPYVYSSTLEDNVCNGQLFTSYGTWNDCISSFKVTLPSCHYVLAFYLDSNYGSPLATTYQGPITTGWLNFPFGQNEAISSFRLDYHTTCPLAAVKP